MSRKKHGDNSDSGSDVISILQSFFFTLYIIFIFSTIHLAVDQILKEIDVSRHEIHHHVQQEQLGEEDDEVVIAKAKKNLRKNQTTLVTK